MEKSWKMKQGHGNTWNVMENELGVMENNLGEGIKKILTDFFQCLRMLK